MPLFFTSQVFEGEESGSLASSYRIPFMSHLYDRECCVDMDAKMSQTFSAITTCKSLKEKNKNELGNFIYIVMKLILVG